MRNLFILPFLITMLSLNAGAQAASKAVDEALAITCEFGRATSQGSGELSKVFFKHAYKFPEKERQSVTVKIRNQLKDHKFGRFAVFDIGDLDGLVTENLLAIGSQSRGTIYFRLRYEPFDGEMVLFHIAYQDKLQKILDVQLMKSPEKVSCPGE